MVTVIPSLPFSIQKVGKDIAKVNNWNIVLPTKMGTLPEDAYAINDDIMIVGNVDPYLSNVIMIFGRKIKLAYLVAEGEINQIPQIMGFSMLKSKIVTPSKFSKNFLEHFGFSDIDIIPHYIPIPPYEEPKTIHTGKDIVYGWLGGTIERKYPNFIGPMLNELKHEGIFTRLLTAGANPFLNLFTEIRTNEYEVEDLSDWYRSIDIFWNISGNEGFGITPLEAMSHGKPAILPDIPPFDETMIGPFEQKYGTYPLKVKTYGYYIWNYGHYHIPIYAWSTYHAMDIIYKLRDMEPDKYKQFYTDLSKKVYDIASKYPLDKYSVFGEYFNKHPKR